MKKIIINFLLKILGYNKYDVNMDGKVDCLDLLILQKYILEHQDFENNQNNDKI